MTETEQEFIRRNIATWQELESENKYFTRRRSRLRNSLSKLFQVAAQQMHR